MSTRVLGYTRISRETEESTSLDRQRAEIERLAPRLGGHVVEWVSDPSVSGSRSPFERPGLGPWLEAPNLDRWDVLVAYHTDRVGRSTLDTLLLVRHLREAGKRLVTVADGTDSTNTSGDLTLTVLAGVAEQERAATVRRLLNARAELRRRGRHGAGPAPYGYRLVRLPDGGWTRDVEPEAAEVVREVAERVTGGESLTRLVEDLNDRGVPGPTGGRWHVGTLHRLLRQRTLLGQSTHRGELVTQDGLPVQFGPAVLDVGTWARVQEALDSGGKAHTRKHTPSLLYGLVRCGICQGRMVASGSGRRESYVCRAPGHSNSILRRVADGVVLDETEPARGLPVVVEERDAPVDHRPRIAELHSAIDRLVDELADGRITSTRARERMAGRIAEYEREAEDLTAEQSLAEPRVRFVETGRTWGEDFDGGDTDERRRMLGSVVAAVWVEPHEPGGSPEGRVAVEWVEW